MTSSYNWVLSGSIIYPIYCTEEGLMGIIKRGGGEPPKLTHVFGIETKHSFMNGKFQIARAKTLMGDPVAVVLDSDKLIATCKTDTIFVSSDYWGQGIASELIAEYWVAWPYHVQNRMKHPERIRWRNLAGEAAERKAYRLMLERGAIRTTKSQSISQ